MNNQIRQQIKQVICRSRRIFTDKIVTREDGTMSVKRGCYTYERQTAEGWVTEVQQELETHGIVVEVNAHDDYREYPAQSYFRAHIIAVL